MSLNDLNISMSVLLQNSRSHLCYPLTRTKGLYEKSIHQCLYNDQEVNGNQFLTASERRALRKRLSGEVDLSPRREVVRSSSRQVILHLYEPHCSRKKGVFVRRK